MPTDLSSSDSARTTSACCVSTTKIRNSPLVDDRAFIIGAHQANTQKLAKTVQHRHPEFHTAMDISAKFVAGVTAATDRKRKVSAEL